MSQPIASLQIDPALITEITDKTVNAQIVAAFGDPALLIRKVVQQTLAVKVSSNGNRSSSDYENRYDLLEVLCANAIRAKCTEIVKEYIETQSDAIRDAFKKELEKPEVKKRLAVALVASAEEMVSEKRFKFDIALSNSY